MIVKAVNSKHFYLRQVIDDHILSIEFSNEANMITACSKTIYYKNFILTSTYNRQIAHNFIKLVRSHHTAENKNNNKNNRKESLHNNLTTQEQRISLKLLKIRIEKCISKDHNTDIVDS